MSLKRKLGFRDKKRTRLEVDRDYTHHAVEVGHKMRIVAQIENEIREHINRLKVINAEGMKLPSEPKPEGIAPSSPESPEGEEHA